MQTIDAGRVEVTDLEAWLEHECGCEPPHNYTPFSGEVVYYSLGTLCGMGRKVCKNAGDSDLMMLAERPFDWCADCFDKGLGEVEIVDCWRIIPI